MNPFLFYCLLGSLAMLIAGALLSLIRIFKGPTAPNRVIGLDLLNSLAVGGVVILSIFHNTSLYLDVILGFVLVIFLGTVAYVQYFLSAKRDKS